ncbi:MAG: 16S rRNA (guanine(527)-N(7))-methyltransferase RsmG [Alphaproteobacteria bacterium]|nr:16S rRNA (guanine(527)-N(7))-methyltransferase RsmG [Alphaproteobacteria bacterium]
MKRVEEEFEVSRETFEKLQKFVDLVLKWNQSINLIAKSTEDIIWERHVLDSMQISSLIKGKKILDIGTGAGFPGIILSIINDSNIILVEKSSKKCTFLHKAKAEIGGDFEIINQAIEDVAIEKVDVITCRGFASVKKILELSSGCINHNIKLILLKGENYEIEIEEAQKAGWNFSINTKQSITNEKSVVLILSNIKRDG